MQTRLCIHMVLHVKFEAWNKEITNLSVQSNDGHLKPFPTSLFHVANSGITGLLGSLSLPHLLYYVETGTELQDVFSITRC